MHRFCEYLANYEGSGEGNISNYKRKNKEFRIIIKMEVKGKSNRVLLA